MRLVILLLFFCINQAYSQDIYIEISNLKNNKGNIIVAIFEDNETFQEEEDGTFDYKIFPKKTMKNGKLLLKFSLPPGTYGFTLVDDENANKRMDYNFFGLPKEGFGFSGYYHSGMLKPHWDKFKFTHTTQKDARLKTKMRYL